MLTKYHILSGAKVKGKIRNLTSYGAFIELEEGLDGMIHVSDISWTRKINHPSEVFKKGDEVEAVVLEVDKANQRISVGAKQLTIDPWSNIDQFYKVGDMVTGSVTKLASFGAFVGLQHDIDGLVHISQVSEERTEKIKNVLKVGQEVTARVIKIDKTDRRIGLSIKAAAYSTEQLKAEQAILESLKPGEDLVALQHAFDAADENGQAAALRSELHDGGWLPREAPSSISFIFRLGNDGTRFFGGDCALFIPCEDAGRLHHAPSAGDFGDDGICLHARAAAGQRAEANAGTGHQPASHARSGRSCRPSPRFPTCWRLRCRWGCLTDRLLVFGRLSADQELTAARASGISLASLVAPVLGLSVIVSLFCAVLNFHIAPASRVAYLELLRRASLKDPTHFLQSDTYVTFGNYTIYARKVHNDGTNLDDVMVKEWDASNQEVFWCQAPRAEVVFDNVNKQITRNLMSVGSELATTANHDSSGWSPGPSGEILPLPRFPIPSRAVRSSCKSAT